MPGPESQQPEFNPLTNRRSARPGRVGRPTAPGQPQAQGQGLPPRSAPAQGPLEFVRASIGGQPVGEVFRGAADEVIGELQELRRDLHEHPEIGLHLPRTQQKVLDALEGLPLEITTGHGLSSVIAVLRGGKRGDHSVSVLLRGDMDALAVRERLDLPFASKNDYMHACGHDLHTAGLVGAAKILCRYREELAGDIIFMFQPGEEGPGGAAPMIEEGVLDAAGRRPIAAYGIHVGPQDYGTFHYVPGPMMSSSSNLTITVTGKGGHGSRPHDAIDPVLALAEIQTSLQMAITRRFDALDPIVVTVTNVRAGEGAFNAIPDTATLGATVRVLRDEKIDSVRQMIAEVAGNVAAAHRCSVDIDFQVLYPTTKTNPRETAFAAAVWGDMFGDDSVQPFDAPMMASEDFGFVLAQVPGTFMFLGTANPEKPEHLRDWNHSPKINFNDSILGDQAAALAALAFERLATEEAHPSASVRAAREAKEKAATREQDRAAGRSSDS